MNVVRQEIRTGLLVLFTLVVLVGVLLYLGAPGVFVKMKTYWVYVDNAAGVKPGADVLLAGRRIGEVRRVYSPVPERKRPQKKLEALIELRVDRSAHVYRDVKVYLTQTNLLSDMLLDITSGDEQEGEAPGGTSFIAERQPGLGEAVPRVLEEIHPALVEATETLKTLQKTAAGIEDITGPNGEIDQAVVEFRKFGVNLNKLTGPDSAIRNSMENLEAMTSDDGRLGVALQNLDELTDPTGSLSKTLKNAERFTARLADDKDLYGTLRNLRTGSAKLDLTLQDLSGKFSTIGTNLEQATDTVKRQPWRLVWPTTKKYPDSTPLPVPKKAAPARAGRTRLERSARRAE